MAESKIRKWLKETIDWARRFHWMWTIFPASWKAALMAAIPAFVIFLLAMSKRSDLAKACLYALLALCIYAITWLIIQKLRPRTEEPAALMQNSKAVLVMPEHRPRVIPAGYGKNEEQKSYRSHGLFVRNPGYDALEVHIPSVQVGPSMYMLVFPEKLSQLCERDHIRFVEGFLEHQTLPGLDGGQLHNVMVMADVNLVEFAIYYKDTNFVDFRTNCVIERTNRSRNGLEVRAISQEILPRAFS